MSRVRIGGDDVQIVDDLAFTIEDEIADGFAADREIVELVDVDALQRHLRGRIASEGDDNVGALLAQEHVATDETGADETQRVQLIEGR
jgi:hypothetical protein